MEYHNDNLDCIRRVSNFGHVKKHHLLDSGSFNKELFKLELPIASPKLSTLLDTIEQLDKADLAKDKKLYKHMIFTDVASPAYGFKIVAASLVSRDYEPCFSPVGTSFHLKDDEDLMRTENNNFGLLASKPMYDRTFNAAFRKKLLAKFNERDANIHGGLVRFMIVDQGFKEGIDLFDIKYVHLVEPLLPSDMTQAVGRSTRFCGQKGLRFIPKLGWPLHVYKYDNDVSKLGLYDDSMRTSEDLWIAALNLDTTQITFSKSLNDATIGAAVDKNLTEAIHSFSYKQSGGLGLGVHGGRVKKSPIKKALHSLIPTPPKKQLGLNAMHNYIDTHFSGYKYTKVKMENKCIASASASASGISDRIITFTPTQDFVKTFFVPESPYKGLLMYHSVGTGKLCSGIATATSSFDKQGYTILWVTRHTLKADFWKNMVGQICNVVTRDKIESCERLPGLKASKRSLISSNWIEPISYKQFTNMLQKENKYYEMLVERNGAEDPLRKTLVIVDECHKLYSENVQAAESPDMEQFQKWIQNSYATSGKESVRLVLMSGTPFTDDAMELVKLINLMKEEDDHLPTDFYQFSKKYLNASGQFTKSGEKVYQDEVSGYVSYLNRSQDARSFSYPVFHDVLVDLDRTGDNSALPTKQYDNEIKTLKAELRLAKGDHKLAVQQLKEDQKVKVKHVKDDIAALKANVALAKAQKRAEMAECMTAVSKKQCKEHAVAKLEKALAVIEIQMAKLGTVKDIKAEFSAPNGESISEKKNAILKIKEMMSDFKLQLKETRGVHTEKKEISKEKRVLYAELAFDLKTRLEDADDKKAIRAKYGPAVKAAKKEATAAKTDAYNMGQELYTIRLKMKRAKIADYSPWKMLVTRCGLPLEKPRLKVKAH